MTDPELVAKKLAFIETCVRELRTLARPERIADDLREERLAPGRTGGRLPVAGDGDTQRAADSSHLLGPEGPDAAHEPCLLDGLNMIEIDGANSVL